MRGPTPTPISVRFWSKVDQSGECWEWTGALTSDGYGSLHIGGESRKSIKPHRYSAMLHFGMFDRRLFVCHTCDNRKCVRPSHLVLADNAWNQRDMASKGRGRGQDQTECVHGHPLSGENLHIRSNGRRECRKCRYIRKERHRVKSRAGGVPALAVTR